MYINKMTTKSTPKNTKTTQPKNTKYLVGFSTKRITDVKMPTKKDGTKDNRFNKTQFCKTDGSRDLRTKLLK